MVPYESYKTLNRLGQPLVTSQRLKAELLVDSDVNQDNCWKMDEGSIFDVASPIWNETERKMDGGISRLGQGPAFFFSS